MTAPTKTVFLAAGLLVTGVGQAHAETSEAVESALSQVAPALSGGDPVVVVAPAKDDALVSAFFSDLTEGLIGRGINVVDREAGY